MDALYIVGAFAVFGMLLQGAFITADYKKRLVLAVILKGAAAYVFVFIGYLGYRSFCETEWAANTDATQGLTKSVCFLICLGLLFGMIGDVLLAIRYVLKSAEKVFFALGALIFFIGHIMYMMALIPMSENLLYCVVIGTALAYCIMVYIHRIVQLKKTYIIFGFFYIEAVVVMSVIAIGNRMAVESAFRTWFAVGAVLFALSDILMVLNFKLKRPFYRVMNLSLYYIGQLLIAISIFFY